MKKLITFLIVSLLLTGCAFRVATEAAKDVLATAPELERVETNTPVLYSVTTEYADGSSEKQVYDHHPNTSPLSCTYYKDDREIGREDYTCDEHHNIISITPSWEGGEPQTFAFSYDEQGRMTGETAFLNGEQNYTAHYFYDDAGNLAAKEIHTDSINRLEYDYDAENRVTEIRNFLNGTLLGRTTTEYNDHGKIQKLVSYDESGNVSYWEDHSFDPKASKETVAEYMGDGTLRRMLINHYDTYDCLLRQEVYDPEDTLVCTTYYHTVMYKQVDYVEAAE